MFWVLEGMLLRFLKCLEFKQLVGGLSVIGMVLSMVLLFLRRVEVVCFVMGMVGFLVASCAL